MKNEATTNETETARKITITIGGPGAGKSYVLANTMPEAKVLDCDAIKAEHPDYDPANPAELHAWSAQELQRRIYSALGNGESFVYDGTGTNLERYIKLINDARLAGYEIEILYVTCDLATALRRNASRERVVPENIVRDKHSLIATSFEVLSRYADKVQVINNN